MKDQSTEHRCSTSRGRRGHDDRDYVDRLPALCRRTTIAKKIYDSERLLLLKYGFAYDFFWLLTIALLGTGKEK